MYPIFLKLDRVPCLVVGAGLVAARKIKALLAASALVTVIAPEAVAEIRSLVEGGAIAWRRKSYEEGDLEGFRLAIAATSAREVNRAVYREALRLGLPVNTVDDPDLSTFFVPAVVRRGPLTVAISTAGAVPYLSRRLREYMDDLLYPALEEDLGRMQGIRARIKATGSGTEEQMQLVREELEPLIREVLLRLGGR